MTTPEFLDWPFFDPPHRQRHQDLQAWAHARANHPQPDAAAAPSLDGPAVDDVCRGWVADLGRDGWLDAAVAMDGALDVRTLCLSRDALAAVDGLADFAFAMQGLGSGAISLFGTPEQRERWLPAIAAGQAIAAFALSEDAAGSDVSAMTMQARRSGQDWVLDGEKTWISNGPIADVMTVFARTGEAPGTRGLSAFVVPADTPGLSVVERLETMAPHPLARLRFTDCVVGPHALIGEAGRGFPIAMATLDVFRSTVGAAALGFARRAMAETLQHVTTRKLYGGTLADLQMTQARIADMALEIDASALLVYRAAWTRDNGADRVTREAAMAKLYATEAAQRIIDGAVQLHGGRGVLRGEPVEHLYRDIRALRIYEGASEVQQQVIARQVIAAFSQTSTNQSSTDQTSTNQSSTNQSSTNQSSAT